MKLVAAVLCLLFASAACTVTMRRERVNVGQFQVGCPANSTGVKNAKNKSETPDMFLAIIKDLKAGMDEKEVAQRFCRKSMGEIPNAKSLDGEEISKLLCGPFGCASAVNSAVRTPIPVHYRAYLVPLKDARHLVSPTMKSGGGAVMKDKGYDFSFLPIFEDEKLLVPFLAGTRVINGERRVFVWNLFGLSSQATTQVKKLLQ